MAARPSVTAGAVIWTFYIGLAVLGTGWGLIGLADNFRNGSQFLLFVNGFQATVGLMLISLDSPTVLAEERVRGSLDVLLATPLSTARIVMAKWWGAYRHVPGLAFCRQSVPSLSRPWSRACRSVRVQMPHATLPLD